MKKFLALFAFLVAAGWTNAEAVDWNWKGDVRYRYENKDDETKAGARERHRLRVRLGVYPWINEELNAGIQLSSAGGSDPVSRNQTLDNGFTAKDINLNQAYIDFHPMDYGFDGQVDFILGKREVKQTFIRENDLVWDSDLTLEGMTVHYGKDGKKQLAGMSLVAGYYFIDEVKAGSDDKNDTDPFFWTAQAAYNGEAGSVKYQLGAGYYNFQNIKGQADSVLGDWADGEGTFGNSVDADDNYVADFDVLELFGDVAGKFGDGLPWKIYGQYAMNVADGVENDDEGYLIGAKIGKAKKVGQWEIDANFSKLEKDAVLGAYTDSDRWGGGTNGQGFEVGGTYHLVQNMTLGLKYLTGEKNYETTKDDVKVWQADMVVKF